MADRYLLETSATDGYQLEDGSGVLLLEGASAGVATATALAYDATAQTVAGSVTFNAGVATGTADAIIARGSLAASLGFAAGRSS